MKKFIYTFAILATLCGLTACGNDEDFTESIFDTTTPVVDPNATTYPFDQWIYDEFVVPYNTQIDYKLVFTATNLAYQVTPADYKKSQLLAHFIKYLFYDVYNKYGEKDANGNPLFMKKYGPRLFHFIGSPMSSPSTHTETQGYASGGVKITLVNVNNMRTWNEGVVYTPNDIAALNKDQFHVLHHEFSHIMHQTKSYPVAFGQVTPGSYDPRNWQERDSTESHRLGYLTQYGSSANTEDFVENLSCIITDTPERWMSCLTLCCLNGGVREGDIDLMYAFIDSLGIDVDKAGAVWNKININKELAQNEETKKYEETGRYVLDQHKGDAIGNSDVALKFEAEKSFTSFRDFVKEWVEVDNSGETKGLNAVLKKIEIATKWYVENWGINIYDMRREVQYRQDHVNDYLNGTGEWESEGPVTIYDFQ
ncbi:MAG: hypothetical protein KBT20_00205 [Bacteroidales bacterium]|nr:hypothetical protein [Candidatus Liminaster caballi]